MLRSRTFPIFPLRCKLACFSFGTPKAPPSFNQIQQRNNFAVQSAHTTAKHSSSFRLIRLPLFSQPRTSPCALVKSITRFTLDFLRLALFRDFLPQIVGKESSYQASTMAPIVNTTSTVNTPLIGKTASVDIPKPRDTGFWTGRDTFAAVTARAPPSKIQPIELPTPPNSISPSIPPQCYGSRASDDPPTPPAPIPVDSDLDLQDAIDHAKAQDLPHHGSTISRGLNSLADFSNAEAINSTMLAKHHLPGILLENGPLPIRNIMAHLTTSVPGFMRIPPARARRIIVGALEGGRVGGGEQGGADRDVIFEKVGWGRWNAVRREQPSRDAKLMRRHQSPRATKRIPADHPREPQIAGDTRRPFHSPNPASGMSIPGKTVNTSHGFRTEYSDYDAEKMSLDGDNTGSSPPTLNDEPMLDDAGGDSTEEEDWARIGPAALRAGYSPRNPIHPRAYTPHPHPIRRIRNARNRSSGPPSSILPASTSRSNSPLVQHLPHPPRTSQNQVDFSTSPLPDGGLCGNNSQEREAIEALVKLKNV